MRNDSSFTFFGGSGPGGNGQHLSYRRSYHHHHHHHHHPTDQGDLVAKDRVDEEVGMATTVTNNDNASSAAQLTKRSSDLLTISDSSNNNSSSTSSPPPPDKYVAMVTLEDDGVTTTTKPSITSRLADWFCHHCCFWFAIPMQQRALAITETEYKTTTSTCNHRHNDTTNLHHHSAAAVTTPFLLVSLLLFAVLAGAGITLFFVLTKGEEMVIQNDALDLATEYGDWFQKELDLGTLLGCACMISCIHACMQQGLGTCR